MLQNDVIHGTKNFFLINGTLRSCQTEIFSTPMFFYSLHLINVYSSFLLCTYSISFISIGWLVSIQTNILFRHIRWQTVALILSSSISLALSFLVNTSSYFLVETTHILILSSHYGSYYSTIYSPSTISFVFSVIRILLLAGRNKKNFIRLQIGHLFSINLQLWQGRDLFFSVSQSYLINSKYMGTLLFQLSLIGKPKKQPYKIHIKVKDFVNYWNIEIEELLWCINKFFVMSRQQGHHIFFPKPIIK